MSSHKSVFSILKLPSLSAYWVGQWQAPAGNRRVVEQRPWGTDLPQLSGCKALGWQWGLQLLSEASMHGSFSTALSGFCNHSTLLPLWA